MEVLRSGQLSLGPRLAQFERALRGAHRGAARERGQQRHRRSASGPAGRRRRGRRRGRDEPVLVRRLGQRGALRAGPAGVRRHRPGDAQPRPARPPRRPSRAYAGAAAGAHLRLPGRHARVRADRRAPRPGDRRGRLRGAGGAHADGPAVGGRGHPAVFGFYANKQLTTGEGGMVTLGRERAEAADRLRAQPGPRPDMGWLDHDRLGFNYRLSDLACALGIAQLERLEEMLAERARVAELYREALGGIEGLELPCDGQRRRHSGLVRVRRAAAARVDRDEVVRASRPRASRASPTCPRSI